MFHEGGQIRKHCFLAMFHEGGQIRKHCFLAMFPEGSQTMKHCFPMLAMVIHAVQHDILKYRVELPRININVIIIIIKIL